MSGVDPKLYAAFGQELSIKDWAAKYGVHSETIRMRLKRGESMENALAPARKRGVKGTAFYEAHGRSQTLGDWSRECGIDRTVLHGRIKRGATLEDAMSPGFETRVLKVYNARQERDHSVDYACEGGEVGEALGISRQRVDQIQTHAQQRAMCALVSMMAMKWEARSGIQLSDDAIAEVVATVFEDEELRHGVFRGRWDWSDVFRAAHRLDKAEQTEIAA